MFGASLIRGDSREARPASVYEKKKKKEKKKQKTPQQKTGEGGGVGGGGREEQTPIFLVSIRVLFSFHVFLKQVGQLILYYRVPNRKRPDLKHSVV